MIDLRRPSPPPPKKNPPFLGSQLYADFTLAGFPTGRLVGYTYGGYLSLFPSFPVRFASPVRTGSTNGANRACAGSSRYSVMNARTRRQSLPIIRRRYRGTSPLSRSRNGTEYSVGRRNGGRWGWVFGRPGNRAVYTATGNSVPAVADVRDAYTWSAVVRTIGGW